MNRIHFIVSIMLAVFLADAPAQTSSIDPWTQRLEQLDPTRPMDYFELAEEVADAAETQDARELARHLFALAGALDPQRLGRSAALALADMEQNEQTKRRLIALATLLNDHAGGAVASDDHNITNETLEAIMEIFSLYRLGRGPQALSTLEDSGAQPILRRHGDLLPGGYNQFLQDCRIYKADLRPTLTDGELVRMLRLEQALLAGEDRSWADELMINKAQPLMEVDPQRIGESLGVDASKSIYRNGTWQSPGGQ